MDEGGVGSVFSLNVVHSWDVHRRVYSPGNENTKFIRQLLVDETTYITRWHLFNFHVICCFRKANRYCWYYQPLCEISYDQLKLCQGCIQYRDCSCCCYFYYCVDTFSSCVHVHNIKIRDFQVTISFLSILGITVEQYHPLNYLIY